MKTGIYMIRNKVNDKKYIGQAVDIDARWGQHVRELNGNKHRNQYLQNSWNKYGEDNFEFTIIHECEEGLLDELEIMYIDHFDTYNNGYNLTLGGDGCRGYKFTNEQRARCSERSKEVMNRPGVRAKISERTKEAMSRPEVKKKHCEALKEAQNRPEVKKKKSESVKGDKNPMKRPEVRAKASERIKEANKRPEVKKKRSESLKKAMNRPEVKAKMSEVMKEENKRRWSDPEYKAKMSEARKGKPKSEEFKVKIRKKVYCATNDTVYASTVEAGEKLGIDSGWISWCCNGKNILPEYPDGHHKKKGRFKDSPVYEFWFLDEYEEKFGKVAI